MKVLIIGAGPTGLTAALEFARKGITPEIVDSKKSPSELSRAVGILPESIEKLKLSGAGGRIFEEGVEIKKVKIHQNNKLKLDLNLSKVLGSSNLLVSLPQNRTETIMSDTLKKKGITVKYNRKVVDIKTNENEALVTFSDGKSQKYDWVIGSDGINSIVREKLGIEFIGYELAETWSIADVELKEEYNQELFSAWFMDGAKKDLLVVVPLGPKRVRVVSSTPDSIKALPIKLNIKNVRREGTFKIPIKQAETYVKGKVLLAGDAAHAFSPIGGKGMNLGIDDAIEAARSILDGKTSEYDDERRKVGARIIRATESIRKTLVSKNPFVNIFLTSLLFLVQHLPPIRNMFIRNVTRL